MLDRRIGVRRLQKIDVKSEHPLVVATYVFRCKAECIAIEGESPTSGDSSPAVALWDVSWQNVARITSKHNSGMRGSLIKSAAIQNVYLKRPFFSILALFFTNLIEGTYSLSKMRNIA